MVDAPAEPRANNATPAQVTLREVTVDTVDEILALKVTPVQQGYVATNAKSIAQAHFYPGTAWFRAIYAGDTPVGFVMVSDDAEQHEYALWRFMIDERYQGRGYGRRALDLVVEYVRTRPGATVLLNSAVDGPDSPIGFYKKHGFVLTGEVDDGELVLRLDL